MLTFLCDLFFLYPMMTLFFFCGLFSSSVFHFYNHPFSTSIFLLLYTSSQHPGRIPAVLSCLALNTFSYRGNLRILVVLYFTRICYISDYE